jgi:hypothetical protein
MGTPSVVSDGNDVTGGGGGDDGGNSGIKNWWLAGIAGGSAAREALLVSVARGEISLDEAAEAVIEVGHTPF